MSISLFARFFQIKHPIGQQLSQERLDKHKGAIHDRGSRSQREAWRTRNLRRRFRQTKLASGSIFQVCKQHCLCEALVILARCCLQFEPLFTKSIHCYQCSPSARWMKRSLPSIATQRSSATPRRRIFHSCVVSRCSGSVCKFWRIPLRDEPAK